MKLFTPSKHSHPFKHPPATLDVRDVGVVEPIAYDPANRAVIGIMDGRPCAFSYNCLTIDQKQSLGAKADA